MIILITVCSVFVLNLRLYILSITISSDERFLKTGDDPLLTICSAGHALHVFVNGQLAGKNKINLKAKLSLIC